MSEVNSRNGDAARPSGSIVRAVMARVLVYGGTLLVVALYLVDFRSLGRREASVEQRQAESATTVPGWPHLRGPHYDAHCDETGLADSWPAEGPPVLWFREIGAGYSGVIAVGDRVYTQRQTLTEQTVVSLDADTGRTLWEHRYGWPYEAGGMYPGPRATPTWSSGRIYFAAPDGLVGCLDAVDGRPLWSVNVSQQFSGRGTDFGYACSPLVEDGKVILPVGGSSASVVALDARDGSTAWTSGTAPASYASAIPITFRGRRQVVAFLQNRLAGFDLATGSLLWQQPYSWGYDEHAAFPLYDEPYLRTMQAFQGGSDLYILEATPDRNMPQGAGCRLKPVRRDPRMSNDVASSVLVAGHVYGFDLREIQTRRHRPSRGEFRCMDFKTGAIRWSSDRVGQATIVAADGKLLLLNDRGEVLLARADPQAYQELGRTAVFPGEICWTAPALHRARLYLRSPTRLACLYVGKPEQLDRHSRESAVSTSEMPQAKFTDLGWLLGAERDSPFDLPDLRELAGWYGFCLAAIAAATVIAAACFGIARFVRSPRAGVFTQIAFWAAAVVFGIVATPLGNRLSGQFVFTWPVSLFAVQQVALMAVLWSRRPGCDKRAVWGAAIASSLLILSLLAYYDLTRRLTLPAAWHFVLALPPSWLLAIPAAQRVLRPRNLVVDLLWELTAFSCYFAVSAALMLWHTAHGPLRVI